MEFMMRSKFIETLLVVRTNDKTVDDMFKSLRVYATFEAPLYRVVDSWLFIEGLLPKDRIGELKDSIYLTFAPFIHVECDLTESSRVSFRFDGREAMITNIPFYKGELAMCVSDFSSFTEKMRDIPIWNQRLKQFIAEFNMARNDDFRNTKQVVPNPMNTHQPQKVSFKDMGRMVDGRYKAGFKF